MAKNNKLPKGMRKSTKGKHTYYFYDNCDKKNRKWISLGKNYHEALKKYADLEIDKKAKTIYTFKDLAERYRIEVIPKKALRTQKDNEKELEWLLKFFNDPPAPLDAIRPINVRQYMDWRKSAPVRANREKALFSHMFNKAREWGYTDNPNPCAGVKGYKESGRDVYVSDELYKSVWMAAEQPLRDVLDLSYLTAQRPADVLKMSAEDIIDNELHITQNKTKQRLRIAIEGELEELLNRLPKEGRLLRNSKGQNLTYYMFRGLFDKARLKAGIEFNDFQLKDLRAKAGTDKEEKQGMAAAKDQLGHKNESMTRKYVRHRKGKKVTPTK